MLDPIDPLSTINPFSRAVVHLTMYFNADPNSTPQKRQELGTGTGFIVQRLGNSYFLITARHNLTGRHPDTGKPIASTCAIPNEVLVEGYFKRLNIQLYSGGANDPNDPDNCRPLFLQHPTDSTIDVAALPFTDTSEWSMAWDKGFLHERLTKLEVTQTCFVVGFPLGLVDRQDPHHVLPIYKSATIASEPYLDFQGKPIVVIDSTTRPGMSGSPVVVRRPYYGTHRNRFVGIYTGRFPRLGQGDDSALGIVYKPKVIQEILAKVGD